MLTEEGKKGQQHGCPKIAYSHQEEFRGAVARPANTPHRQVAGKWEMRRPGSGKWEMTRCRVNGGFWPVGFGIPLRGPRCPHSSPPRFRDAFAVVITGAGAFANLCLQLYDVTVKTHFVVKA